MAEYRRWCKENTSAEIDTMLAFWISSLGHGSDADAAEARGGELRRRNQEIDEGRARRTPAAEMIAPLDEKYG